MHYYKRNLGDYAKKAGRLSILQHGVYNLLIDACYDREKFPTLEEAIDWVWAGSTEEIEAVEFVLRKFFTMENGVYIQDRIRQELDEYYAKAETNRRVAIEREEKRKAKEAARATEETERERIVHESFTEGNEPSPNHKPLTNNHKPIKEKVAAAPRFTPPSVAEVSDYISENGYPVDAERFVDFYESKGWVVGKTKMKDWKAAVRTWSKRNDKPNNPSGGNAAPKQTAAQRIAARRQQLATQSPDMGVVATDDGDVWAPLDEPAGRGTQRYLASGNS